MPALLVQEDAQKETRETKSTLSRLTFCCFAPRLTEVHA